MIARFVHFARRLSLLVPLLFAGVFAASTFGGQAALATIACGTPFNNLVTNGGFETPVVDVPTPWPDGTSWTASGTVFLSTTQHPGGGQSASLGEGSLSQTLDTSSYSGATLVVSFQTASGGFITVGTGAPQSLGWNGGTGWGPFSTTYVLGPNETSVALVFSLGDGSNGSQADIDDVVVSVMYPCPTPTPTKTPTPTNTPIPTDTAIPTETPVPTDTPTAAPTDTATTVVTVAPTVTGTVEPTSTAPATHVVYLSVVTSDGGSIPASANVCVADQCSVAGASVSAAAASGTTFIFSGVASGDQPVTITNAGPYADLSTTITVASDADTDATVTLQAAVAPTEPGNATPVTTATVGPAPTSIVGAPTKPAGATSGTTVKSLPNTGTGSDSNSNSILALFAAMVITTVVAAYSWRRRTR